MLNFCTLFDINYLSRGMAMYQSLRTYSSPFHLYVFAFDDKVAQVLSRLALPHLTVIRLSDFEDETLLALKPTRSRGEYCWTCTPSTIRYVLNHFPVSHCTYIDADLYFYADPGVLLDEMDGKSVLITEHRFSPRYAKAIANGKYCVQFMTFRKDTQGMKVLQWWRDACNDWCYNRFEDGKFGDQKYLDDWTTRFEGVHELQHLGGGVAPWNIQQYNVYREHNQLRGAKKTSGESFDFIFYHFHGLRFLEGKKVDLCEYSLSEEALELIYRPYLRHLSKIEQDLRKAETGIRAHEEITPKQGIKTLVRQFERRMKGDSNIYDRSEFVDF